MYLNFAASLKFTRLAAGTVGRWEGVGNEARLAILKLGSGK
jgi:hypothetical protein